MKVTVPVLKYDVLNQNNRKYTSKGTKRAIKLFNQKAKKESAEGEIARYDSMHEANFDFKDIKNPALKIENLHEEGDTLYANIEVLDNDQGKFIQKHLDMLVFRPRSIGEMTEDNVVKVLEIISVDAIPKSTDAFDGMI